MSIFSLLTLIYHTTDEVQHLGPLYFSFRIWLFPAGSWTVFYCIIVSGYSVFFSFPVLSSHCGCCVIKLFLPIAYGHDDNLEFLEFSEFSEFLNSKIPSSELSLFALYRKTITRNFSRVWDFHFESKIPSSELSLFALYRKTITRNFSRVWDFHFESKIPSSELSLFALYRKTITWNFSRVWDFHFQSKIPSSELSLFALYRKTITRNFFLSEIYTLKAK